MYMYYLIDKVLLHPMNLFNGLGSGRCTRPVDDSCGSPYKFDPVGGSIDNHSDDKLMIRIS